MADYPFRVRPEIVRLATRPERITLEEYRALRCNSWEWETLIQNLSDEALVHAGRWCVDLSVGQSDQIVAVTARRDEPLDTPRGIP